MQPVELLRAAGCIPCTPPSPNDMSKSFLYEKFIFIKLSLWTLFNALIFQERHNNRKQFNVINIQIEKHKMKFAIRDK